MAKRVTKAGRVILTGIHYAQLREAKWKQQNFRCADCGERVGLNEMQLHHLAGRGMNGWKRNDTLEATKGLDWKCHSRYEAGVKVR